MSLQSARLRDDSTGPGATLQARNQKSVPECRSHSLIDGTEPLKLSFKVHMYKKDEATWGSKSSESKILAALTSLWMILLWQSSWR